MADSPAASISNGDVIPPRSLWSVISASCAGTLIEWYDFYIFGTLTTIIAPKFFPSGNETVGILSTLATFAAGFVVRPFGALVFGKLGDTAGRKHTFLFTLILMGLATFAIGLVPGYSQIGIFAPLLLLILRLVQGLALGGEYGGAATYVTEHCPRDRRGFYTSFLQTTATLGFLVSIAVVILGSTFLSKARLGADSMWLWDKEGWRIAFFASSILVIFSYLIRRKMEESPVFAAMKAEGRQSKSPLKESFANPANLKLVLLALFGATLGQGVVWYTSQFYAQIFLTSEMKMDKVTANTMIATALVLATPLFVLFGHLSDKLGRKKLMMTGLLLAAILYYPAFMTIHRYLDTSDDAIGAIVSLQNQSTPKKIKLKADEAQLDLKKGDEVFETTSDVALENGIFAKQVVHQRVTPNANPDKNEFTSYIDKKLERRGTSLVILVLFGLVGCVTLVYAPIAAFLVELFPTRIRYSSLSLPYHIGNGVFGGFVPLIATSMVAATHNPLASTFYPIGAALLTLVVGSIYLKDRHGVDLHADDDPSTANDS